MVFDKELLSVKEASIWATEYLDKNVTTSNISYLTQYGRIKKIGDNGSTQVIKEELIEYYKDQKKSRQEEWKEQLGEDLNLFVPHKRIFASIPNAKYSLN